MTTTNSDPLEDAIRSVVERAILEGWGHIRLEEDGAKALDRVIRGMVRTAHANRGATPLLHEDVQFALVELERRLVFAIRDVASQSEGIVGRDAVNDAATAICPLPPICRRTDGR